MKMNTTGILADMQLIFDNDASSKAWVALFKCDHRSLED